MKRKREKRECKNAPCAVAGGREWRLAIRKGGCPDTGGCDRAARATAADLPESGREIFRSGGCEILRLEWQIPKGDTAAARHAAAVGAALCGFVRKTLTGEAEAALKTAVQAGQGYRFSHYVCRVNAKIERRGGKEKLCVSFVVQAGGATLHAAAVRSVWDAGIALAGKEPRKKPRGGLLLPKNAVKK